MCHAESCPIPTHQTALPITRFHKANFFFFFMKNVSYNYVYQGFPSAALEAHCPALTVLIQRSTSTSGVLREPLEGQWVLLEI